MFNIIALAICILVITVLYDRYIQKYQTSSKVELYHKLQDYLLNKSSISKKSIIWIHIPYKYNAREWESFYSRTSTNLNLPYQYLTIKSIIDKHPDYHICLIDDDSFNKLIPNWTVPVSTVAEPVRTKVRLLAMLHILDLYGGMIVPSSFLCLKSMDNLYQGATHQPFIISNLNKTSNPEEDFLPDPSFIGCRKKEPWIQTFIHFLEILISKDNTNSSVIQGTINKWCREQINLGLVTEICPTKTGITDINRKPLLLDDWFGQANIELDPDAYGIYIPQDELLQRNHLNWFCYLQPEKIYETDNMLAKYLTLAK